MALQYTSFPKHSSIAWITRVAETPAVPMKKKVRRNPSRSPV